MSPLRSKEKAGSYNVTRLLLIGGVIDYLKRNRYTLNNRIVGVNLIAFKPDICFISLDVKYNIQLVLPFAQTAQKTVDGSTEFFRVTSSPPHPISRDGGANLTGFRKLFFCQHKNGWRKFLSATHIRSQSGFIPVLFPLFQHRFYLGDQLFLVGHIQHITRGEEIV